MGTLACHIRLLGRISLAILVAASLLLIATAPLSADRASSSLPTLHLAWYAAAAPSTGVLSFDPALVADTPDAETIALVNGNLVHLVPNGRIKPDLATWTISRNRLVYTFTIRANARFSNGHAVTAADAAFSIQRALAPATGSPPALTYLGLIRGAADYNTGKTKTLSGVKVVSRRVLRITITKPAAYFVAALSYPTADVLDPSVVRGKPVGTPPDFKDNYLTTTCSANQGAGPFMFTCRNRGSKDSFSAPGHAPTYTLVPNPYYYGRKPHIRIRLPVLAQDYRPYLAGSLDQSTVPPVFLSQWKGKKEFHPYPSSNVVFMRPNLHMAPFDNVHCRLAVAYAIDRETIANRIAQGAIRSMYTVVPKGMLGYYAGKDNPHYNPRRARAELARCPGRTVPFELTAPSVPGARNPFTATLNMLKQVGMNVTLKELPGNDYGNVVSHPLDQSKTQMAFDGWAADYLDPQDYITILLRCGQHYDTGGYCNKTFENLVDRADVAVNARTRATLYIRAQHLALSQGAFISRANTLSFELLKLYVRGMVGTEAYGDLMPRDLDWANVSIGKH